MMVVSIVLVAVIMLLLGGSLILIRYQKEELATQEAVIQMQLKVIRQLKKEQEVLYSRLTR